MHARIRKGLRLDRVESFEEVPTSATNHIVIGIETLLVPRTRLILQRGTPVFVVRYLFESGFDFDAMRIRLDP